MENLKLLIFKNTLELICEIKELSAELGEPDCKLINPLRILNNDTLERWPNYTNQKEIIVHSDSILTIVDPEPKYIELYLKAIK
jgi:hypothetical protein